MDSEVIGNTVMNSCSGIVLWVNLCVVHSGFQNLYTLSHPSQLVQGNWVSLVSTNT